VAHGLIGSPVKIQFNRFDHAAKKELKGDGCDFKTGPWGVAGS
jgi:hypothetical protein